MLMEKSEGRDADDENLPRVISQPSLYGDPNHPNKFYLPRNLTGYLECHVDANPPVSTIVWSKNGSPVNSHSNPRYQVDTNGTLVIRDVRNSDEGLYTCQPYSFLGAGNTSELFQVYVRGTENENRLPSLITVFHNGCLVSSRLDTSRLDMPRLVSTSPVSSRYFSYHILERHHRHWVTPI
ncbi:hypothetical protein HELRODRAFT_182339 [Helobdella robusta]|uniref:Ig-like domain-containing protein n=1 Tax=Helobdella robusta TaxID=6412 RepID=T1FI29_HELRO|nr:hypothetical protein HELRODRAFT_182339 [Helobdella robusta]ESN90993.1 hypothetical protein HELRODRAFT_182339 [Helobdella robusta]